MKEARAKLRTLETDVHRAQVLKLPIVERLRAVTFTQFAEETYFPAKAPPTRRERSQRRELDIFAHVKPILGEKVLSSIGTGDIEDSLVSRSCPSRPPPRPSSTPRRLRRGRTASCPGYPARDQARGRQRRGLPKVRQNRNLLSAKQAPVAQLERASVF